MADLAISIFEFLTKFLVFWHPWNPWVCIRSDLKPLFETDMSNSSQCAKLSAQTQSLEFWWKKASLGVCSTRLRPSNFMEENGAGDISLFIKIERFHFSNKFSFIQFILLISS